MSSQRFYNPKNWKVGDRVSPNPSYNWSWSQPENFVGMLGTVTRVTDNKINVKWDNGLDVYYSYADSSLIKRGNVNDFKIDVLPDSLFEI